MSVHLGNFFLTTLNTQIERKEIDYLCNSFWYYTSVGLRIQQIYPAVEE